MAQSMARLVNFWNDQPGAAGLGMRISVISSPASSAVSNRPRKKSPAAISRLAGRPADDQRRVQGQDHRGQVGRGVAVGQRAADRAAVPDLRVADLAGGVREQRQLAGQHVGGGDVVVAGERADREVAAVVADVAELAEPADVDQGLRHRQPQLHQREQRVPAGQELRVFAALGRQVQGLVHGGGPLVGEGHGNHQACLSLAAAAWSSLAAARTARTMLW